MNTGNDLTMGRAILEYLTLATKDPAVCAKKFCALGQSGERLLFNEGYSGTQEHIRTQYHEAHKQRQPDGDLREEQFQCWFEVAFHAVGKTTYVYEDEALDAMHRTAEIMADGLVALQRPQGRGMSDPFKPARFASSTNLIAALSAFVSKWEMEETLKEVATTRTSEPRLI